MCKRSKGFTSIFRKKNKHSEKADSLSRRDLKTSESSSVNTSSQAGRLPILTGSSDHQYITEIIPAGTFHYSPAEGFTGTASRVTIHGRLKSTSAKKDSVSASKTVQVRSDKASQEQQISKSTKEKEVKRGISVGTWLVLIAVVVVAGVVYVKWKRRRVINRFRNIFSTLKNLSKFKSQHPK